MSAMDKDWLMVALLKKAGFTVEEALLKVAGTTDATKNLTSVGREIQRLHAIAVTIPDASVDDTSTTLRRDPRRRDRSCDHRAWHAGHDQPSRLWHDSLLWERGGDATDPQGAAGERAPRQRSVERRRRRQRSQRQRRRRRRARSTQS